MKKLNLFLTLLGLLMAFQIGAQTSEAYNWHNVVMGGGGFVSGIIAAPNDQNVFYARTDVGGAYRWDESTKSWIPLLDWLSADQGGLMGIDGIAVDPEVKGRVYILAGTAYLNNGNSMFLRSDDYGNTWDEIDVTNMFKAHGNGMGRANGERIAVDPNNSNIIFIGTRYNGLWKSTNRGTSWSQISTLNYTPVQDRGIFESGVCVVTFDKNSVSNGITQTIYAGISRETNNVYVSHDAGATWSLIAGQPTAALIRPQRMALTSDGHYLYITYGNGGGPHPMLWSGVTDYYNRGAIYKYDTQTGTWTDISPENYMLDLDKITDDVNYHYGAYSGISIDPNNDNRIIATSINSWRAAQMWYINGTWQDKWGDNIYLSEDGGVTWRNMFRYYWVAGGYTPDYNMISAGDFPWITGNTCHWNGSVVFDPFNSNRAFVTSGNGVFSTNNLSDYAITTQWVNNVLDTIYEGRATWTFTAKGIEETVPLDMISIPGGPFISAIGDYDGFVQNDITVPAPNGALKTIVQGQATTLGTTTGLAYAAQNTNVVVKAAGNTANVNSQTVSICGITISTDGGATFNQIYAEPTPVSVIPVSGKLHKGKVAVSADGAVVLWAPMSNQLQGTDTVDTYHPELFRYENSSWSKCTGIEFSCNPIADPVNVNVFYAYNATDGYMYVSTDKGATFTKQGYAGTSDYKTARVATGQEGDLWVPLASGGLTRSVDGGTTFSPVSGISFCESVGFGKAAAGSSYPAVYIYGTVGSVTGVFRSIDQGASWVRVNDDQHQYGGPGDGQIVIGDANVYGRVYMSTAGRGIVYGDPAGGSTTVHVTGVSVSPASLALSTGQTGTLTATVTPSNASNQAVTWSTSNSNVATVNINGVVTAVGNGSATITATTVDGSYTAGSTVTVSTSTISVTGVTVTPTSLSLSPGGTGTLTATVSPGNATNKNVSWSSSNSSVATVSSSGVVTAVANGTANVTVTTADGGYTVSCAITVSTSTISVTGVTLTPTSLSLSPGGTGTLAATVSPANATNQNISWSTSNSSVATVNSSGVVTAVANGTANVTVTTADGGFTASCAVTVSSGGTLPSPWQSSDIGSVAAAGSASYSSGTFTVAGSGADIWGTADAFRYVYQPVSGDVEIIARVVSLTNTNSWAKAGVMVRQSLTAGSVQAITVVTPGNGTAFQRRTSTNGSSTHTAGPSGTAPYWVRLVNSGGTVTSYVSSDGSSWTQIGSVSLGLSGTYYVGLCVCSHNDGTLCTASIDNVTVNTGTSSVPVTGVSATPTSASVNVGATTTLTATVAPGNATNQNVSWSSDNTGIATVNSSGVVTGVAAGNATITVTTADGGYTASSSITVNNTSVAVTGVSVTPTSATVNVGATTALTASVAPGNATNQNVSWSSGNTNIATVNSSGVVTGVAAGNTTITVTTADGGYTASSAITVNNTSVAVTGVSVTPTSASVNVGAITSLTATVAPGNATNKNVSWSSDNTVIATVNSSGVVTGVATGSATITVTTADGGFTATSTITVTNGTPCNNPVTITIPFSQDGIGDYCWVTSQSIAYINSWNMDLVEVNGADFTNVWSNNLPAPINGNYYIHYVGSYDWSHFEAPATKGAETLTDDQNSKVRIYPNPFSSVLFIDLRGVKNVSRIDVYNTMGQLVKTIEGSAIKSPIVKLDMDQPGNIFILNIQTQNQLIIKKVIKQ